MFGMNTDANLGQGVAKPRFLNTASFPIYKFDPKSEQYKSKVTTVQLCSISLEVTLAAQRTRAPTWD